MVTLGFRLPHRPLARQVTATFELFRVNLGLKSLNLFPAASQQTRSDDRLDDLS